MPLVHDFVPMDTASENVVGLLLAGDRADVVRRLDGASDSGGPAVEVGPPRFREDILVIPMRFTGGAAPFDSLDGDLRVEPVGSEHTHLSLVGSYEVSLVSRSEARVRQRLTESWARDFLTRVSGSFSAVAR
jgi:hypothetical protein